MSHLDSPLDQIVKRSGYAGSRVAKPYSNIVKFNESITNKYK